MIEGLVAKRYAEALFEVASERNLLGQIEQELELVVEVIKLDEENIMTFLRHPQIDEEDKKSLIKSSFKDNISEITANFLYQLIENKRIEYIEDIKQHYIGLANKARDIVNVDAITSTKLNTTSTEKIVNLLNKELNQEIRLNNIVNPSILGGMVIRIGDRVYDGSINKQLKTLKRSLTASRV